MVVITTEPPILWKDIIAYRREKQVNLHKLEHSRKAVAEYWRNLRDAMSESDHGFEIAPKGSRRRLQSTDPKVPSRERETFAPRYVGAIIPRQSMPIYPRCREACCLPILKKRIEMQRDAQFAYRKATGRAGPAVRGYAGVDWEWHQDETEQHTDSESMTRRASGGSAVPLLEIDLLAMAKPAKPRRKRPPPLSSRASHRLSMTTSSKVLSHTDCYEEWECIEIDDAGQYSATPPSESQTDDLEDLEDWIECGS